MEDPKKKKYIRELIKIINTLDEFRPTSDDPKWKKKDGLEIMAGNLQYNINDHLIKKMELFTKMYSKIPDIEQYEIIKKFEDNVAIIYVAEDEKKGTKYVGFTTNPLLTFIKFNLHKRNLEERDVFENFESQNPKDIIFKVLEYVKYEDKMDIIVRRRYWKSKLISEVAEKKRKERLKQDKEERSETSVDPEELVEQFFEDRMELFYSVLEDYEGGFRPFTGHIYVFRNPEEKKEFIGGFERKTTKDKFIEMIIDFAESGDLINDINKYGKQDFQFREIEKFKARSPFDFMLRLDFWKLKKDTLNNGYNTKLSMEESEKLFSKDFPSRHQKVLERNFFLKIQRYLFIRDFKDEINYENIFGFVYEIKNKEEKKRYFASSFQRTLKDTMIEMYDKALDGNVKHNRILKALMEYPYESFEFKIIKIKKMDDTSLDLNLETENLIGKFKTRDERFGYNIDYQDLKRKIAITNKAKMFK